MKNQFTLLGMRSSLMGSLMFCLFLFMNCQNSTPIPPPPTSGKVNPDAQEDEGNAEAKERWFALLHQSAPEVSWEKIEYENRLARHQQRAKRSTLRSGQEVLANGQLIGEWFEVGSNNNAGSVLATEYDVQSDQIYLISAGGTLWRGTPHNEKWTPLNEDLKFQGRFLERIILPNDQRRMLAMSAGIPMYSDDEGVTWTPSTGINIPGNGSSDQATMLTDGSNQVYLFSKPSYWTNLTLYTSNDLGESYQALRQLSSHSYNNFALLQPHHSTEFYLIEKLDAANATIYKRNLQGDLEVVPNANFPFGSARANVKGFYHTATDSTFLYAFDQVSENGERTTTLFRSKDEGVSWEKLSELPINPWQVGLYISPSNPNLMLIGGVECFRSEDGGRSWIQVNRWQDYYDDIVNKLHADMMIFNEFKTSDDITFQLISNHGGLNISYNEVKDVGNIGMIGLNVGQFYDVQTDQLNRNWVYGGTQDQGFQRGEITQPNVSMPMEQVWSGDYGHMAFTNNNQALWTVYPGGLVYRYNDPKNDPYPYSSYRLESKDESVWIPPLIADPDPSLDITYLAGGNPDGDSGSFIIKLSHSPWTVNAEKHSNFDFKVESGDGEVSALAYSKLNSNLWYAATTNGRFFYSEDRGISWEQTLDFVPGGQYLYGASIFPSPLDEQTVYLAGSGYSNPAVLVSKDGGATFLPLNNGLPSTLVIELTGDPEGQFLFAATESGPFVYSFDEGQWFDMAGIGAPAQTYWSVEYLADLDKVRFGTYGRGIWDFNIQELNVSTADIEQNSLSISVFPNPSNGQFSVQYNQPQNEEIHFQVFDLNGKLLDEKIIGTHKNEVSQWEVNYSAFSPGIYLLTIQDGENLVRNQIVIE